MKPAASINVGVVVPITGISAEQIEGRRNHLLEVCSADVTLPYVRVSQIREENDTVISKADET